MLERLAAATNVHVARFAADGEEKAGRTLPGRSRVSGEFGWNAKMRSWVVNDKSGRYMSESVRPGLDAEEAADWLANVAALFSDRLGVVVRTDQVKTAAPVPAAVARQALADALSAHAEAVGAADAVRQQGARAAGLQEAVERVERARGRVEDAEATLIGLGVTPYSPGPSHGCGGPDRTPAFDRDGARRQWLAQQVTAADLPAAPPRLADGDTVSTDELKAAGALTTQRDIEAQLSGGSLKVGGSGLQPLEQVRLSMVRPGPWPPELDAVAATVARRLWHAASEDFAKAAPAPNAAWAWDTAIGLVLSREEYPVLADSRYAAEEYRAAVRRIAHELLTGGADPRTVVRLAARLRRDLGIASRY